MKNLIAISSRLLGLTLSNKAVGSSAQSPSRREQIREEEYEALVDAELMEVTDRWCGRLYSARRISARAEASA